MSSITPNIDAVTSLLADTYAPLKQKSSWYCENPYCDGDPHTGWEWQHCRAKQRPPDGSWFIWVLISGRGFGKSRTAAEWILKEASEHPSTEWAVLGPTAQGVRKCADDLDAGLYHIAPDDVIKKYNRSPDTMGLHLNNGSIIHLISADKPDRLRGYNLAGAWCDEIASWRYGDAWLHGLLPAMRNPKTTPHIVVTSTPKPLSLLNEILKDEHEVDPVTGRRRVVVVRGATYENFKNLSPDYIHDIKSKFEGTRIGRQEIYGEILSDVDGALVNQEMIERTRLWDMPSVQMVRVVVAVDPARTTGENSDETGIIVCAKGADGRGYVLDDLSCHRKTPDEWAQIAVRAYHEYRADRLIAEKTGGDLLVEAVIRSREPNIAYTGVNALRGKALRAEPVAALYEQGKISHVGSPENFQFLESQWTSWIPDARGDSPDRVDALVHGITALGLVGQSDAHIASWAVREHPNCLECNKPSPRGTLKCPYCGADKSVNEDPVPEAATPTEVSTLTSWTPSNVRGDPQTQAVMKMLEEMNGPQPIWRRTV